MNKLNKYFSLLIILIISGCGGGGSSGNVNEEEPNQNAYNLSCNAFQVNTQKCSLTHNGIYREYYIYIPSTYTSSSNASLMFVLHGYGSNATNILYYSDFQSLSEQDEYILVYPQGALLNGVTHWNVGGWTLGSTINDVDFIETIIEIVSDEYYINTNRIYSTGMSNGGYMSYHLACNTNLFAAVASVTGSMTPETYNNCNPRNTSSVLQIHGLQDYTVPYTGAPWSKTIPEVMEFWGQINDCNEAPLSSIADQSNGTYIYYDSYQDCNNNSGVELILHSSMGHTWPSVSNHGFSATAEVWSFFKEYDLNGKIN